MRHTGTEREEGKQKVNTTWITTGILIGVLGALGSVAAPVAAYEVATVNNGGTISGKVNFKGTVPEVKVFKVEKTPEVCGEAPRKLTEVAVNGGELGDVVVVLEGVEKGKPYSASVRKGDPPGEGEFRLAAGNDFVASEISPKKCNFGPFTGIVAKDKPIRFVNRDPVKHSPHTYEIKGRVRKTIHNTDLEGDGKLELVAELQKSRMLKLECDQHNHMQNFFYAVENPYFAISEQDGSFSIDQVPPGSYKLTAWHPVLGLKEQQVTVAEGGKLAVNFEFVGE